jgi:nucleotide-binding universal stress UspA family protein
LGRIEELAVRGLPLEQQEALRLDALSEAVMVWRLLPYGGQDASGHDAAERMQARLASVHVLAESIQRVLYATGAGSVMHGRGETMSTSEKTAFSPQGSSGVSPYRRIVVALDGSARAEGVLPHVAMLARQFGAAVTLLRVVTPPGPLVPEVPDGAIRDEPWGCGPAPGADPELPEAAGYVRALAVHPWAAGVPVDWVAAEGQAAEAIVERARGLGADLIGMTTHGRGALARHMLGSVADEVMRRADCPVLLLRAPEAHDPRPEACDRGAPHRP